MLPLLQGLTGVCWSKDKSRWRASICVNGKNIHLGYKRDMSDAIAVRREAEKIYFKEFRYERKNNGLEIN